MLKTADDYTGSLPYPYEKLGSPAGLLFFDIETTGLSARTSHLYLIGCLFTDGRTFHLKQWFATDPGEEKEVLTAFSDYLKTLPESCLLLHFNGNVFDLPYLRHRMERFRLPFLPDRFQSMDLYRSLRPYKAVLGLPSLRQKAVESYLGIVRTDPFDGGQLIAVYEDYVSSRSDLGLKALLLHNAEDVRNMPKLLAALSISDYMEADYSLMSLTRHEATSFDGSPREELLVALQSPVALRRPISLRLPYGPYLTASKDRIRLAVPLQCLTLRHYFPNVKDYFYLPHEDRAVHKSVGIYVDKEHRQKAVKDNCYIKKSGLFFPCPPGLIPPEESCATFMTDRRDKNYYLEWNPPTDIGQVADTQEFWNRYVHALWNSR
ncbi:MAG: ribonuclease H-like domain-containing protein [Lachnospiraceae bacterium]|jgi:hypothetical protein|nr:ribonuclease H-like domain-containing protein [Lachnospiraceae bacterium]